LRMRHLSIALALTCARAQTVVAPPATAYAPTPRPSTYPPTPSTYGPSAVPTYAPTTQKRREERPTVAPTPCPIQDDPLWHKWGDDSKDCQWVAVLPEVRCDVYGQEGRPASQACARSCGACDPTAFPTSGDPSGAPSPAPSLAPTPAPSRTEEPSAAPTPVPSTPSPTSTPTSFQKLVRVGFFPQAVPMMAGIGTRLFDDPTYRFAFFPQSTGAAATAKLDAGELDIAIMGTAPLAGFSARGVDLTMIYLLYEITTEEALAVRDDIISPRDLFNTTLAAPPQSSSYMLLLFVREVFEVEFRIKGLAPDQIVDEFNDGKIDGAFVWGGALAALKDEGRILLDAALLRTWGEPASDVVVASSRFAFDEPEAVDRFAGLCAALDASFAARELNGLWDPAKPDGLAAAAVAAEGVFSWEDEAIRAATIAAMATHRYVDASDQLDPALAVEVERSLDNLVAVDVQNKFLYAAEPTGRWYPRLRPPRVEYAFLARGVEETYDLDVPFDGDAWPAPSPQPVACALRTELTGSGVFADGSGDDAVYAAGERCEWVLYGDGPVVRVAFPRVALWVGDELRVYDGIGTAGDLLGVISGFHRENPFFVFDARENATVVFTTDVYSDASALYDETTRPLGPLVFDPGFSAAFFRPPPCDDSAFDDDQRNCAGTCVDGLCRCPPGFGGAGCFAALPACLGTVLLDEATGAFASALDALLEKERYAPDDVCRWVIRGAGAVVRFWIEYDVEITFDKLQFYSGEGGDAIVFDVISGNGYREVTVPLKNGSATVEMKTDDVAARSGFNATYEVLDEACSSDAGCFGDGTCRDGACVCPEGYFGLDCASTSCIADSSRGPGNQTLRSNAPGFTYAPGAECRWRLRTRDGSSAPFSPSNTPVNTTRLFVTLASYEVTETLRVTAPDPGNPSALPLVLANIPPSLVARSLDFPFRDLDVAWRSDRNDGGKNFKGFRAEFHPVLTCPGNTPCESDEFGGTCREGVSCFKGGGAYDCPGCDGGAPAGFYLTGNPEQPFAECPPGTEQPTRGNLNVGADSCIPCSRRSYAPSPATERCTECPEDSTIFGNALGSTSAAECVCRDGYYSRTFPIAKCFDCPRHTTCLGGVVQPYPKAAYWTPLLADRGSERPSAYRCRYSFYCTGGKRSNDPLRRAPIAECLNEINGTCRSATDVLNLEDPANVNGKGWCAAGRDPGSPLCEDEYEKARGKSWFALSTLSIRCPRAKPARHAMVAFVYIGIFALFVVINDYIRPAFLFLDVVLNTYQDLGIIASFWLYWPPEFDFLFTYFNIALFDINVFEPTCAFPWWGPNEEFYLMISMPFIYLMYAVAVALVFKRSRGRSVWVAVFVGSLRFLVSAQAALADVVLAPWACRSFHGMSPQRRRVEAPMENCDGASLTAVRVIAAFYGLGVVLLVPVLVILRLVWYRRHNLLRDPAILERYGFIYEDFRSSALFYIVPQQAYKILLIVIKTAFWKYPLAQGWGGITVMLAAVWLHATYKPYRKPLLNSFEQAGLGLALLTLALGLLFTSQIIQRDEQKIYEVIYYMLQGAYLVAALYCVRHAGLALAKKHVAGYVVEYVGALQREKMERNPHRLVHSASTLHGHRVPAFIATTRLGSLTGGLDPRPEKKLSRLNTLSRAMSPSKLMEIGWARQRAVQGCLPCLGESDHERSTRNLIVRTASTRLKEDPLRAGEARRHEVVRARLLQAYRFQPDAGGWKRCQDLLAEPPNEVLASFKGPVLLESRGPRGLLLGRLAWGCSDRTASWPRASRPRITAMGRMSSDRGDGAPRPRIAAPARPLESRTRTAASDRGDGRTRPRIAARARPRA